jgi:O-antigen/teichoic acid export membrane protein
MIRDILVFKNVFWLSFDRGLKFLLNLAFTVFLVKKLTVIEVGQYYYVLSFVSIFSVLASLGIQDALVKHFSNEYHSDSFIVKNNFILLLFSSCVSLLILFFCALSLINEKSVLYLVLLQGITILIRPFEVVQFYLDRHIKSRDYIRPLGIIGLFITCFKLLCLFLFSSVYAVIVLNIVEFILSALVFIFLAVKNNLVKEFLVTNFVYVKDSFRESFPYFVMALSTMLYVRIDTLMIEKYLGFKDLGYYTASTKLSEIWYIFPMIISTSLFPRFLEKAKIDVDDFMCYYQKWMNILVKISVCIAIIFVLFSDTIIFYLFGGDFLKSSLTLKIHIWSLVAVCLGIISSKWYIINEMPYFLLYRAIAGLSANICLNLFLIPKYGISGAAFSTVISYLVSDFFFDLCNSKTRILFKMKIKSLLSVFSIN